MACPASPGPPSAIPAAPCKLDLLLLSQPVANLVEAWLYPVNAMRNRAVANARTEVQCCWASNKMMALGTGHL